MDNTLSFRTIAVLVFVAMATALILGNGQFLFIQQVVLSVG
jgi:hypothetical protein